ncbi:phosphate acetyltransferase [Propionimicrobium sp. PCR01-08-3]|uniref:phosphate acetyltransferase n=1 Tax=Propionimicrobium sp. PCR01-08-3 TaxID=3052086 RepID=UPI00255C63F8|nr:phosphate acetyltransferase [Propionimicrobium sp. PCR01-08-3]WIY82125.1 phosphate acetyltransferase [Propionimicrobium sp. PCR01-08-3]
MTSEYGRPAVYLCPTEHCPHLLQMAIGLLPELAGRFGAVGVFRPIIAEPPTDPVLDETMRQAGTRSAIRHWGASADEVLHNPADVMAQIIERYAECAAQYDALLVLGSEYDCSLAPIELSWNTRISANIDVPMILVVPSHGGAQQTVRRAEVAIDEATRNFAQVLAVITPRSRGQQLEVSELSEIAVPAFVVDEVTSASTGLTGALDELEARVVAGTEDLSALQTGKLLVADMGLRHLLPELESDSTVVFSADRSEIGLGMLIGGASGQFSKPAGAVAVGPWPLADEVCALWNKLNPNAPLLRSPKLMEQVYRVVTERNQVPTQLSAVEQAEARSVVASQVNMALLFDAARPLGREDIVTPLMFEHRLLEQARKADQHIVLPEGAEERILRAAARLLAERICRLTLLGNPEAIKQMASDLGLSIAGAQIIDPETSELREKFAAQYAQLRAKKGISLEQARERVGDGSYFGTMMVLEGLADGMVSGSVNTTAHTIRPALEMIKTKPGVSVVSSVFLMCLADRVLVFGDCAVNPNPTPEQVADIAITSAATAKQFGVDPRVAMLSYSTGSSGKGPDVDQTIEATRIVRERAPELVVDGPLQYDAAVDAAVANTKMPDSPVAGKATVMIFPDLQTGNTTYKAVQRSSGALAIGPVLQGLNKPVNDLSRGALVSDIVNTVAITAIQAGLE